MQTCRVTIAGDREHIQFTMADHKWLPFLLVTLCVGYCQGTILDMTYTYNNHTWYHYINQKGFTNVHRVREQVELRGTHLWYVDVSFFILILFSYLLFYFFIYLFS